MLRGGGGGVILGPIHPHAGPYSFFLIFGLGEECSNVGDGNLGLLACL